MFPTYPFSQAQDYKLLDLDFGLIWRFGEDRWVFGRNFLFTATRTELTLETAKSLCERLRNAGAKWQIWANVIVLAKGQSPLWGEPKYFGFTSANSKYAFFLSDYHLHGDLLISSYRKKNINYIYSQNDTEINLKNCSVAELFAFLRGHFDGFTSGRFFEKFQTSDSPFVLGEHFSELTLPKNEALHYESTSWGSNYQLQWSPIEKDAEGSYQKKMREELHKTILLAGRLRKFFANFN